MKFKNTLFSKMLAIFLITAILPAISVVFIIPKYYNKMMTENIDLLKNTIMVQANNSINNYIDYLEQLLMLPYMNKDVMNALRTLKLATTEENSITEFEKVSARRVLFTNMPNYIQYSRNDVFGTVVCFDETNAFAIYEDGSQLKEGYSFKNEEWYEEVIQANGENIFIGPHTANSIETNKDRKVFSVAKLIKDIDTKTTIGILKIDVDTKNLGEILGSLNLNTKSKIAIVDDKENIIYSNDTINTDFEEQILKVDEEIRINEEIYAVNNFNIEGTGWTLKVMISKTEYIMQTRKMQFFVIMIYTFAVIVATALYSYLSKIITKPLKLISNKMQEVEKGNFDVRVDMRKNDEISRLGQSFNSMTQRLQELIDREYKAVIASQRAQYKALQSQIEPHFIYNVLMGMIGINRQGDKKLMEEIILALSGFLRYITEHEDEVTVEEEVKMIEKYCWIQKLRLQKRLEYTIEIEEKVKKCLIPKLLLQPLVENAIIHGIEPKGEKGNLLLKGMVKNEYLIFLIKDTGVGFEVEETQSKLSIGLNNVKNRVKLLEKNVEYKINSIIGEGTSIEIKIFIGSGENEDSCC